MYEPEPHKFGSVTGYARKGTNDWNTLNSMIIEDEYKVGSYGITNDDTVIDIGSHIGGLGLALKHRNIEPFLVSVEPFKENIEIMDANYYANNMAEGEVIEGAVGNEEGETEVFYGDDSESGIHHNFIGNAYGVANGSKSVKVDTITFTDIINVIPTDEIALLKIDCEGGEYGFFESATPEQLKRIRYITGEYHKDWKPLENMLVQSGLFEVVERQGTDQFGLFTLKRKVV
jgi:FkbM family methyltransferase